MRKKVVFSVNRSSSAEIADHLFRVNAAFEPALSSRVEILSYSYKLHELAVRFEAWQGKELIGLVASYCNQPYGGKAFVTSVSVWTEFQGLGIAHHLMQQCIEYVRNFGLRLMELQVDQSSLAAIALYKELGFSTLFSSGTTLTMGMTLER